MLVHPFAPQLCIQIELIYGYTASVSCSSQIFLYSMKTRTLFLLSELGGAKPALNNTVEESFSCDLL